MSQCVNGGAEVAAFDNRAGAQTQVRKMARAGTGGRYTVEVIVGRPDRWGILAWPPKGPMIVGRYLTNEEVGA